MTSKYKFAIDEKVRIKVGPFTNFTAGVVEINKEKGLPKVVEIFGRSQSVEVAFLEVEKAESNAGSTCAFLAADSHG